MTVLRIDVAGLATLQDLGRPGLAHLGIAASGAADARAAQVTNVLVGNAPGEALIEVTGSEFAFTPDVDVLLAVTGAAQVVLVAGSPQPVWEILVVPGGSRVTVPAPTSGLRSYVAVNGRLDADRILGSVAPDRLLGIGRSLAVGDALRIESAFSGLDHPHSRIPVFRMGVARPKPGSPVIIEVTRGPDAHEFSAARSAGPVEPRRKGATEGDAGPIDDDYEVSPQSDAIGLRLLGPTPQRSTAHEILSRGVPVGAIEVPPGGGLLALLRGRLVTAGYPVVAVATLDSIDRLGQVRPADRLRFRFVDARAAQTAYRGRQAELVALADRVRAALSAVGLGEVLDGGSRTTRRLD